MRTRAFTNNDHTFNAEMPLTVEIIKKTDINQMVENIEKDYNEGRITLNLMITHFNKIYMEHFLLKDDHDSITMLNKLELYYAHQVISGPMNQREGRKKLIKYWVEQKR